MALQTSTKLIDLSFLNSFTKGDQSKMKRYIEMYLKSTPLVLEELFSDLENNHFEDLRLKAHSIKPQARYMGISKLTELLIQIEAAAINEGGVEQLKSLVLGAKKLNDQAMIELKLFLNQH